MMPGTKNTGKETVYLAWKSCPALHIAASTTQLTDRQWATAVDRVRQLMHGDNLPFSPSRPLPMLTCCRLRFSIIYLSLLSVDVIISHHQPPTPPSSSYYAPP